LESQPILFKGKCGKLISFMTRISRAPQKKDKSYANKVLGHYNIIVKKKSQTSFTILLHFSDQTKERRKIFGAGDSPRHGHFKGVSFIMCEIKPDYMRRSVWGGGGDRE
jgi:hypothetical protein